MLADSEQVQTPLLNMSNKVSGLAKAFNAPDSTDESKTSRVQSLATRFNHSSASTSQSSSSGAKMSDIASRFGSSSTSMKVDSGKSGVNQPKSKPRRNVVREKRDTQEDGRVSFEKASRLFSNGADSKAKVSKLEKKTSVHATAKRFESNRSSVDTRKEESTAFANAAKRFSAEDKPGGGGGGGGALEKMESAFTSASAAFKERSEKPDNSERSKVSRIASQVESVSLAEKGHQNTAKRELEKAASMPAPSTNNAIRETQEQSKDGTELNSEASTSVSKTAAIFEKGPNSSKFIKKEDADSPTEISTHAKATFDKTPNATAAEETDGRKSRFADACKAFSMT